jgi:hypothetical protein
VLAVHEGSASSAGSMGRRVNAVHATAALGSVARALGGGSSSSSVRQQQTKQGVLLSSSQRQEAAQFLSTTLLPLAARAMGPVPDHSTISNNNSSSRSRSNISATTTNSNASTGTSNDGAPEEVTPAQKGIAAAAAGGEGESGMRAREAASMLHALATARHAPPLPWLALYLEHVRR